jgi:hypothetical protein
MKEPCQGCWHKETIHWLTYYYPKNILSAQQICCMNWIFQGQLLQLKCVTTLVEVHFNCHMVLFSLLVKKEVCFILLYFILFLKIFLKCIFLCKKMYVILLSEFSQTQLIFLCTESRPWSRIWECTELVLVSSELTQNSSKQGTTIGMNKFLLKLARSIIIIFIIFPINFSSKNYALS